MEIKETLKLFGFAISYPLMFYVAWKAAGGFIIWVIELNAIHS